MKLQLSKIPAHLGFIIDGNGRWAKDRGLSRSMGHRAGLKTLEKIVKECFYTYGIQTVSVYAFSSENWNRPKEEVDYLMGLFRKYLSKALEKDYPDVKINIMGNLEMLDEDIQTCAKSLMQKTANCNRHTLNLAINYGGQDEIVNAINNIIKDGVKTVSKKEVEKHLYTKGQPPLDLVVRTSGEQRLSNFMLWQAAYAELYFTKVYWPAFSKKDLAAALKEYQNRNRRFGAIQA